MKSDSQFAGSVASAPFSCHNSRSMFRGLVLTLVLTSVGISLPTRTG
jgi:hypothetical protein